nr:zinc finger, CW-type [Tanacetum cinerariifolium]
MAVKKPFEGINLRKTIENHSLPKERSNGKRSYKPASLEGPHVLAEGNELGYDVVAAMVVLVVQEDWVCCDKCEKWWLLSPSVSTKSFPKKWLYSMFDWLLGMNRCSISQEEIMFCKIGGSSLICCKLDHVVSFLLSDDMELKKIKFLHALCGFGLLLAKEVVDTISPPKFDFATNLFDMLSMGNSLADKVSVAVSYAYALWAGFQCAFMLYNLLWYKGRYESTATVDKGLRLASVVKSECPRELEPIDRRSSIDVNLIRRDENCLVSLFS